MKKIFILFIFLFAAFQINAATRTASVAGNWNNTATWGGSAVPTSADAVTINDGIIVTVNISNAICASLSAVQSGNAASGLTFNASSQLTVSGNVTITGKNGSHTATLDMTSGGIFQIGGTFTNSSLTFTPGTGTVDYTGTAQTVQILSSAYNNLTLSGSGSATMTGITVNGILSMAGTATASVAPTYGAAATLQYNTTTGRTAGVEWITPFAATGGVKIANTGAITLNAAKVLNANVPDSIRSGATLNTGNFQLTFGGNFDNSGTFTAGSSPIVIAGIAATQSIDGFTTTGLVSMTKTSGTATFQGNINGAGLTINGSGGTLNLGTALTHTFTGDVTLSAGTLNGGSSTLNENNVSVTAWGGTGTNFTASTSTVVFGAAGNQTLSASATTFNNLTLSNSGTKTAGGNLIVNGNLTVASSVILNMSTFTLTGTLTIITNSGTIKTSCLTNPPLSSGETWGGLIEYATSGQYVPAGTYNNLKFDNASGTNTTVGIITVNGTLTATTGGTLALGNNLILGAAGTFSGGTSTLKINANLIVSVTTTSGNNCGLIDLTTANVTMTYGGTGTLNCTGITYGANGILNFSSTGTIACSGNVTTSTGNQLTCAAGTFSCTGSITGGGASGITLSCTSGSFTSGSISITSSCTVSCGSGTFTTGNLVVTSSSTVSIGTGILTCNNLSFTSGDNLTFSGAGLLNIGGAFTISVPPLSFTPSTGTVNFNGTAQTVPVLSSAYNNLTLSNSGTKTLTATPTVNGILSMEGTATASIAPTYGASATLQYNTATSRTAGIEWITPFVASGGVIIDSTGTITLNAAKTLNATAPLTINSGASFAMSTFLLTLNGNLINNGGTTSGSGGVTITGTAAQSIGSFTNSGTVLLSKTGGTATFTGNINGGALTINGTSGTLNLGTALTHTFTGDVTLTAGSLNGGSSTLNENNVSATAWGGTGSLFTAGTSTVVIGASGNQTLSATATTFNNLTLSGSGTKTITTANVTVNGIFSMEGTATASAAPTYGASATLQYKGSAAQTTGVEFPSTALSKVNINNSNGVTLSGDKTIPSPDSLKLTSGLLKLNGHILKLNQGSFLYGNGGSDSGKFNNSNSNYVQNDSAGYLYRYNSSINGDTVLYPVGTSASYTPVKLYNAGGDAGNYGVFVITSTRNDSVPSECVNKQWTIKRDAVGNSNLLMTFYWNSSDEGIGWGSVTQAYIGHYSTDTVYYKLSQIGSFPIQNIASNPRFLRMTGPWQDMDFYNFPKTYSIGANQRSLPVELSTFTSTVNGRDVSLTWETKTEKNSDKFIIERTINDGNPNNLNWRFVTSVKAANLSNSPKHYSFTDKNLQSGKYQYRLKMVDNDGTFEYSKVVETEISLPKDFELSQNYPNPFNPSTKINYSLPNDSRVTLEVYNIVGERVALIVNESQPAGYYTVNFGPSSNNNVSSGIYLYKLTAVDNTGKNFTSIKKMMLIK